MSAQDSCTKCNKHSNHLTKANLVLAKSTFFGGHLYAEKNYLCPVCLITPFLFVDKDNIVRLNR